MFPLPLLLNPLPLLFGMATMTGILLHDTTVDKAVVGAIAAPAVLASYEGVGKGKLGPMPHVHTERSSLSQAVNDIKNQSPRLQPRDNDKRFFLQKATPKGHHAFDNYNLPIV